MHLYASKDYLYAYICNKQTSSYTNNTVIGHFSRYLRLSYCSLYHKQQTSFVIRLQYENCLKLFSFKIKFVANGGCFIRRYALYVNINLS